MPRNRAKLLLALVASLGVLAFAGEFAWLHRLRETRAEAFVSKRNSVLTRQEIPEWLAAGADTLDSHLPWQVKQDLLQRLALGRFALRDSDAEMLTAHPLEELNVDGKELTIQGLESLSRIKTLGMSILLLTDLKSSERALSWSFSNRIR